MKRGGAKNGGGIAISSPGSYSADLDTHTKNLENTEFMSMVVDGHSP